VVTDPHTDWGLTVADEMLLVVDLWLTGPWKIRN
jgi:hypothetical protein